MLRYILFYLQYTTGAVKDALPSAELTSNICAVCEREIVTDGSSVERTYRLTCDHLYLCYNTFNYIINSYALAHKLSNTIVTAVYT